MKDLKKIVSFGVFIASIACLVVMWTMFFTMFLHGERKIILYADYFGEFWIELVVLTLAIIFLPVLLYEFDEVILKNE